MQQKEEDVIIALDIMGLNDREKMEKHLKREGLKAVDGEPFCYIGKTSTQKINTMLYVFDSVKKALLKGGFEACNMVIQIGEGGMDTFRYDKIENEFVQI